MTPQNLSLALTLLAIAATVVGFLACAILVAACRHDPLYGTPLRKSVARWGGTFFGGAALILIDCAMGDRGPVPMVAGTADALGLGAVATIWALVVGAGFAMSRALSYSRKVQEMRLARLTYNGNNVRPFRGIPYAGGGLQLVLLLVLASAAGCASGPSPFNASMHLTEAAVSGEWLAYVDRDPALTQTQKNLRHRTVDVWRQAIAENANPGGNGGPVPATQPASP